MKRILGALALVTVPGIAAGQPAAPAAAWHTLGFQGAAFADGSASVFYIDAASVSTASGTTMFTLGEVPEKPQNAGGLIFTSAHYQYRVDCGAGTIGRTRGILFVQDKPVVEAGEPGAMSPIPGNSIGAFAAAIACKRDFSAVPAMRGTAIEADAAAWLAQRAKLLASTHSGAWVKVATAGSAADRDMFLVDRNSLAQAAGGRVEFNIAWLFERPANGVKGSEMRVRLDCGSSTFGFVVGRDRRADGSLAPVSMSDPRPTTATPGSGFDQVVQTVCSGDWRGAMPIGRELDAFAPSAFEP